MNKYQEALNYISTFFSQVRGRGNGKSEAFIKLAESLTTLQELIDNYTKFNEDKSCQYICDTKALLEEELSIVKERLSITEKALDNACEFIEDGNVLYECKKPIKEIFLEESEKQ